jgi:hypothetical protein
MNEGSVSTIITLIITTTRGRNTTGAREGLKSLDGRRQGEISISGKAYEAFQRGN